MPGERDLWPIPLEARDRDTLQEITIAGIEVVVDGEGAVAVVLGPDELGVAIRAFAFGAEDVEVAVAVEIGDRRHLIERRTNRPPLPGPSARP